MGYSQWGHRESDTTEQLHFRSHLFIFAFISFAFGDLSKKILLRIISENVLPVLSLRSFVMSCFISRCLNYFEFIFVYGVEDILLHVDIQFSQSVQLKDCPFLTE